MSELVRLLNRCITKGRIYNKTSKCDRTWGLCACGKVHTMEEAEDRLKDNGIIIESQMLSENKNNSCKR
jgi:hypothetical protein